MFTLLRNTKTDYSQDIMLRKRHALLPILALVGIILPVCTMSQPDTEETPFLWFGRPYYSFPPQVPSRVISRYGDTPKKFPSASSCGYEQGSKDLGNLANLKLSMQELEVCLFRIFTKVGDVSSIDQLMKRNGWVWRQTENMSNLAHLYNSEGPITQIVYYWGAEENGNLFGLQNNWSNRIISVSVEVVHDKSIGVVQVTLNTRSM